MTSSRLSVADVAGEVPRIAARAVLAKFFLFAAFCSRGFFSSACVCFFLFFFLVFFVSKVVYIYRICDC